MQRKFKLILPDEPYKTATSLQKSIEILYEGQKFLLICIDTDTGKVDHLIKESNESELINPEDYSEDGKKFCVIDAEKHLLEAAYITNRYSYSDTIPDYEFSMPGGYEYKFSWMQMTGAISQSYFQESLYYDPETDTFVGPERRTHYVSRESFMEGIPQMISRYEGALDREDVSPEEKTIIKKQLDILKNLDTVYKDIDHWKIPFLLGISHI